jgi:sRNA-binding carbon storage regulator CsrA
MQEKEARRKAHNERSGKGQFYGMNKSAEIEKPEHWGTLNITRRYGEEVVLSDRDSGVVIAVIGVLKGKGEQARIAIKAPMELRAVRAEIYNERKEEYEIE